MNKSEFSLVSILGIISSVIFIWVFLFSIWYSNTILNQKKFVYTTTAVLQSEEIRSAISSQIVNSVQEKRPIVGAIAAPLLTNIITGVMDSNLYSNLNTKIAQEIQIQLTSANPKEVYFNVKPTKDLLSPILSRVEPELLRNVPDRVEIIRKNQIPSLYLFGTYLTITGPILLISALIILGFLWTRISDKRNYITILSLTFAGTALLVYFLVPALGNYIIAQTNSIEKSLIVSNLYYAFFNPISQTATYVLIGAIVIALIAKFVKKEIFRLPDRISSSKK